MFLDDNQWNDQQELYDFPTIIVHNNKINKQKLLLALRTNNWRMKIAIHHRKNSFSEHWINYCKKHNIPYKIVDAYSNNIIEQVADCDIFMWHHHQSIHEDSLFANQLLYSLQIMGKYVYPDFNTTWHFDDKIGQRYLFEALNIPFIPTYIFYDIKNALKWIKATTFPKVFKLRNGASSNNVMLVKSYSQAKRLIKKAFKTGISTFRYKEQIKDRYRKYKLGLVSFRNLLGLIKMCLLHRYPNKYYRLHNKETGYVYFQDYLPNNKFDIRVFVVGDKAIVKKRINKDNDFRASGSEKQVFDKDEIDIKCVKLAFDTNQKLKMQSVAFDFLYDTNGNPIITEVSYCRGKREKEYTGYYSSNLQWHDCRDINTSDWIIESIIAKFNEQ